MAQHDMADSGGYDEKSGFMRCPLCGDSEHVVMVEDGVWMCTQCTIEFNGDGRAMGGLVQVGKFGLDLSDVIEDAVYVGTVWVSAPKIEGRFAVWEGTISLKSVGNVDELMRELYESLKRASE